MTLTLLLQLTDEEQLYASRIPEPTVIQAGQAVQGEIAPAIAVAFDVMESEA